MEVRYDCSCFERELVIKFPDGYEYLKKEIMQMLDDYYFEWHDAENIKDPVERAYVQDSCLEEYMMDKLSETYNMWDEWTSEYYGDNPEEMEDESDWTKNERRNDK